MAASDYVISSKRKVREGEVGANRPNSEAVNQILGGSINGLIDSSFYNIDIHYDGYFSNSELFRQAPIMISKLADIVGYQMSFRDSGNSGNNVLNFGVFNNAGAFVNNLFNSGVDSCSVSGNNGTDVLIGRDLDASSQFSINNAGHSIQYGNLNITTLQTGYYLAPFVESGAGGARGARFLLRLREQ